MYEALYDLYMICTKHYMICEYSKARNRAGLQCNMYCHVCVCWSWSVSPLSRPHPPSAPPKHQRSTQISLLYTNTGKFRPFNTFP